MLEFLTFKNTTGFLLMVCIGTVGGLLFRIVGAPMPFLLGSLVGAASTTLLGLTVFGVTASMPMTVRNTFVAVIGVMIGGNFSSAQIANLDLLWGAAIIVPFFVAAALLTNFLIFRLLGGYDKTTAFFAAMPGGLIETIAFGEKLGADIQILTLQQFSRVILVITALPFIFLIWTGEKVGSAAGVSAANSYAEPALSDIAILVAAGVVGLVVGRALRLPAAFLVGPLIASALVHLAGLTDTNPPDWFVSLAQIIIGTGLGSRFAGFKMSSVLKSLGLSVISVAVMLSIDAAIVLLFSDFLDMPFDVLLISFAPGGVTETALIALSLGANPVFVTSLHVLRIVVTVLLSSLGFRLLARAQKK